MRHKLSVISKLIVEHFWWKVLSVAVATAIWAVVATEPELATFATVRLEYKNLPDDLEISSDPVSVVSLELRGPSGELRGLGESGMRPAVVLEMSDVQPGERTFAIGNGSIRLPRGVHLVRAIPSEVRFRFERRVSRRVPVMLRIEGEGQNGYVVAHKEVEPRELQIVGPSSHVARVTAAMTDPVDVSGVVGSSEYRVHAFVEEPFVRFEDSPLVVVNIAMRKK